MENLKAMVVPVILKGPNYILWSRTVKTCLCSKGLWDHIAVGNVGLKAEQDRDEDYLVEQMRWFQADQTVLALLHSSIDTSILEAYSYCESAKELWETLFNVFGNASNLSRVYEVKKAITELKQEGTDFTKHFGKFRALWAEMDVLRPSTTDPFILNERKEQDRVFSLLMTLDSNFNDLIKHILRADKLPSLEEVCGQIQKEQGTLGLFAKKGDLYMANQGEMVSANKAFYRSDKKKVIYCDHCKKQGHIRKDCWLLHPHLRPPRGPGPGPHARYSDGPGPRANYSHGTRLIQPTGGRLQDGYVASATSSTDGGSTTGSGAALGASSEFVKRSDLDALIKALKESGISYHSTFNPKPIVIDSGASHHMISDARLIENVEPALGEVVIANGSRIPIKGLGDLKLFDRKSKALYMPSFTSNLLSVKRATSDLNCYAIFGPNDVFFQDIESQKLLGQGTTKGDLYVLDDSQISTTSSFALSSSSASVSVDCNNALWHARLGHPHARALNIVFPGLSFENNDCDACILGKHCRTVFPKSATSYDNCFDLVHSDVWTSPCLSREHHRYFVTFIDEKSKFTWLTLLSSKNRVQEAFQNFHSYVATQYNAKVKILRSDNGGEYMSHSFKEFLSANGIIHQTSCAYTPQQNGVAERKNRHLMEVARSMMFHMHVPKHFWSDAVMAACYLINRLPTRVLHDKSPFEVLNKTKPYIDHLRVFGCVCYVLVPEENRNKLEAKSTRGMFLGYSITQKGYKCFLPEARRVVVSRDVRFHETEAFYTNRDWADIQDLATPIDREADLRHIIHTLGIDGSWPPSSKGEHQSGPAPEGENGTVQPQDQSMQSDQLGADEHGMEGQDEIRVTESDQVESDQVEAPMHENNDQVEAQVDSSGRLDQQPQEDSEQVMEQAIVPLRRSQRVRKARVYFNAEAVAHPIQAVCSVASFPEEHQVFISALDQASVPKTYEEAIEHEAWRNAVTEETGAMERNHTWDEADLPKGKRAVGARWVFTIKYKSNGEVDRYKARLVAKGFTQTYGEDYSDTFAPVAKLHTVRVLLSVAANHDWELWQLDVKNAFLQGELEEEVYMVPPPGLERSTTPGKVLRLRKAIYGLKQSPRAWYRKLSQALLDRDFMRSESDHSLFVYTCQRGIVVILIYVDDIIISGNDKVGILETKSYLMSVFDIKDLGELKYFLGIEVCRTRDGLFLSQRKYATDLLIEAGDLGDRCVSTPIDETYKDGEIDDQPFVNAKEYRRVVGKLVYLTITRPDLCFAVNQVSQYMKEPTMHQWGMVNRILRYIRNAPGQGIWMGRNLSSEIVGYCDADWAGDHNDRRSTTGYCTFIGGNLVTWKSKKQKIVSCSSAEAEYRAMRRLTTELMWLKMLMKDLGFETTTPMIMHCDNQAAIHIASNPVFHERTKHIEVDCHKVREQMRLGNTLPCYTKSSEQLADVFTKAISQRVSEFAYEKLGLTEIADH